MPSILPDNPTIEALKKEAKALLKTHRSGEPSACKVLRQLKRFKDQPDAYILESSVKLAEAQFALALGYGSDSWENLVSDIAYQDRKHVEKVGDAYRYTCRLDRIKKPKRRFFEYSDLTLEEHALNQHHNELQSLLALADLSRVPNVLEYDSTKLTMTVEDMGQQSNFPDRRILDDGLRGLAEIHKELDRTIPSLKRCWHTVVDQSWYFQFDEPRALELRGTAFGRVLDELPSLLDMVAGLPKRFAHGDPMEGNTTFDGERLSFIDFGDSHLGYQMNDVAVFLSSLVWKGEPSTFSDWMDWWGKYADFRGDCTDEDLKEFLFMAIRKSARRLSKRKPCAPNLFKWLVAKGSGALDELHKLGV